MLSPPPTLPRRIGIWGCRAKAHTVPPATGTDRQSGGPALGLGTGPGLGTRVPADDRDWH